MWKPIDYEKNLIKLIDPFEYLTTKDMMNGKVIYSPLHPRFELFNIPKDNESSPKNKLSINSPLNKESKFHIFNLKRKDIDEYFPLLDFIEEGDESRIEETQEKLRINASIIQFSEYNDEGKKLFFTNYFVSDVNDSIDTLNLSDLFSDSYKILFNEYIIFNNQMKDIFSIKNLCFTKKN